MDRQARNTTMAILFGMAALYLLILCCLRKRIEMTARTLTTAGEALSNTAPVFITCFVLFLIWVVLGAAMSVGMVVAFFNGEWEAIEDPEAPGEVESCLYKLNTVGTATLSVCGFVFLWTSLLFTELRGFVVAGTIGHWYYHSQDASQPLDWPSLTAFKLAFTKSFGSMCLGSLILAIIQVPILSPNPHLIRTSSSPNPDLPPVNRLTHLTLAVIQVVLFIIRAAREANRDSNNGALKLVLCLLE